MEPLGLLPPDLLDVRYDARMIPGYRQELSLAAGSNCQRFAYAFLQTFGRCVPPFRSSELWDDHKFTTHVSDPAPLDLVLFGPTMDPYGAHIGVVIDDSAVLHLCREVGSPAVWAYEEFACRERYRSRIGCKRVRWRPGDGSLHPPLP